MATDLERAERLVTVFSASEEFKAVSPFAKTLKYLWRDDSVRILHDVDRGEWRIGTANNLCPDGNPALLLSVSQVQKSAGVQLAEPTLSLVVLKLENGRSRLEAPFDQELRVAEILENIRGYWVESLYPQNSGVTYTFHASVEQKRRLDLMRSIDMVVAQITWEFARFSKEVFAKPLNPISVNAPFVLVRPHGDHKIYMEVNPEPINLN